MHKGRVYPYLHDLWAVSAFFWRGYVPYKMRAQFFFQGGSYWSPLEGFDDVSDEGVVSVDREFVRYDWTSLPAGVDTLFLVLGVALAPVKSGSWNLVADGPAFASPAGAICVLPAPLYGVDQDEWPDGPPVGIQPYTPPELIVTPARWGTV